MFRFDGETAVITGAANGMGLAVASLLSRQGAFVCMLDIEDEVHERAASLKQEGLKAASFLCDVSDANAVEKVFGQIDSLYGPIGRLVNVAGISANLPFLESGQEAVKEKIFKVNIDGVLNTCRAALPSMIKKGKGSIVNFSSVTGPLVSDPGMSIYSATKAAVSGLSRALAVEFAEYNIRVNCILPGYIWTRMLSRYNPDNPDEIKNRLSRGIPLGRLGTPEEAASAVLFLLSNEASYITGHDLVLDGGATLVETKEILKKGSKKVD